MFYTMLREKAILCGKGKPVGLGEMDPEPKYIQLSLRIILEYSTAVMSAGVLYVWEPLNLVLAFKVCVREGIKLWLKISCGGGGVGYSHQKIATELEGSLWAELLSAADLATTTTTFSTSCLETFCSQSDEIMCDSRTRVSKRTVKQQCCTVK